MAAWRGVDRKILLGSATLVAILVVSPVALVFSKTKPDAASRFSQIFSGAYTSGSTEDCRESEFVLVNWNIRRGVRLPEILEVLQGPLAADLYILQEVDLHTRRTGYRNVAEEIARELGMDYVFGIEFQELSQGRSGSPAFHGQAVISRLPISRSRARTLRFNNQLHNWGPRWFLPRWAWLQPRRGGRMALVVEIQLGGKTWAIYNTHLESKAKDRGRVRQVREILDDIDEHYDADTPIILAGDLNTDQEGESPILQELKARGFHDVLQEYEGSLRTMVRSNRRADWILLRPQHRGEGQVLKMEISDHYPLIVRIGLPETPASCSLEKENQPSTEKLKSGKLFGDGGGVD